MLSWNKFRQGWVNYISVYFTTSAFQIIKASQLKLNINSDVKRGDSWKQLLWEWPFPELNVDCSKSKCNVFCGLTAKTCCGQQSVTGSAEITERVLYDDNIDLISIAGNI